MVDTCERIMLSDPNARIIIGRDVNKLNITELITQHPLQQMVKSPTRSERILDVFLTNYPLLWRKPFVFNSLVRSDHRGVLNPPHITTKLVRKNVMFRDVPEHRSAQTYTMKIVFTTYGLRCSDNLNFSWFLCRQFANLAIINLYSKGM